MLYKLVMIGWLRNTRWLRMLYVLCSLMIVLGISCLALWIMWKMQLRLWTLTEKMMEELKRQQNLLVAKDLTTFSTLQTLSNTSSVTPQIWGNHIGLDDESMAKHIAQTYMEAGIDPASAYDSPDDALGELGLKGQGF